MNKIEDNLEKNIKKINIPSKKNYVFSFVISLLITIIINNIFSITIGNLIGWIFDSSIVYSIFFSPVFKSISLAFCFRLSN